MQSNLDILNYYTQPLRHDETDNDVIKRNLFYIFDKVQRYFGEN